MQAGSVTFDPLHDEHWTRIPYRFNRTSDSTWDEGEAVATDAEADYDERRDGPTHDLYFIRSATVAQFVMHLVRDRHKTLPWRVAFETINLCGTNTDLGDVIGLTHTAGLDEDGWENVSIQTESVVVMPGDGRVRLTGRLNRAPHESA